MNTHIAVGLQSKSLLILLFIKLLVFFSLCLECCFFGTGRSFRYSPERSSVCVESTGSIGWVF